MPRFIQIDDYNALTLQDVKAMLTEAGKPYSDIKRITAEDMAIGQLREYIGGKYAVDIILSEENRNMFILMILLDLTLYHLYSAFAPKNIPQHRSQRYDDAIQWLVKVGQGEIVAQLPLLGYDPNNPDNPLSGDIRINSQEPQNYYF